MTTSNITVSAAELDALRMLAGNPRAVLSTATAAELEIKGLIMKGWNDIHVLTPEGDAALLGLGTLIKPL